MSWAVTVAAVIEQGGRFLLVEEREGEGPVVLNQPAGHVEPGEAVMAAVIREVWEETGLAFTPEALVGVYQLRAPNGKDYLRVCFAGTVSGREPSPQDPEILAARWFSPEEIAGREHRSTLVARCLADWASGQRLPLAAASVFEDLR